MNGPYPGLGDASKKATKYCPWRGGVLAGANPGGGGHDLPAKPKQRQMPGRQINGDPVRGRRDGDVGLADPRARAVGPARHAHLEPSWLLGNHGQRRDCPVPAGGDRAVLTAAGAHVTGDGALGGRDQTPSTTRSQVPWHRAGGAAYCSSLRCWCSSLRCCCSSLRCLLVPALLCSVPALLLVPALLVLVPAALPFVAALLLWAPLLASGPASLRPAAPGHLHDGHGKADNTRKGDRPDGQPTTAHCFTRSTSTLIR